MKLTILIQALLTLSSVVHGARHLRRLSKELQGKTRPNIVIVLVDDMGWNDVGYGEDETDVQTPVLDTLATEEGLQLNRHYAYNWCGPSRSSIMTGRLPTNVFYSHVDPLSINPADPANGASGASTHMTMISEKMKEAGYKTAYTGKWGVGYATADRLPINRGYDRFFGYLSDSNDYWTETRSDDSVGSPGLCELGDYVFPDLWKNDGPAWGLNGTDWEDYMFGNETLKVIEEHDADAAPLFLFHAFHSAHTPHNPPEELQTRYGGMKNEARKGYVSLVSFADQAIGEMVDALKAKGMWENTIMLVSSDNGGPIYPGPSHRTIMMGAANNGALRGGKTSDWEGGIRVRSFLTGGFLPEEQRGQSLEKYIHFADWYATFSGLAGIPAEDMRAKVTGVPAIDSIDQWELLSGKNNTELRTSMLISDKTFISGTYKLITGNGGTINPVLGPVMTKIMPNPELMKYDIVGVGYGTQAYRNALKRGRNCTSGCLFDIFADPSEEHDISEQRPAVFQEMMNELAVLQEGIWNPDRGTASVTTCAKLSAAGFYGPFYPQVNF